MNPDFFNYGSFPIYLMKAVAQLFGLFGTQANTYDGMLTVGRILSSITDVVTVYIIYITSLKLFRSTKSALLASFLYAIAFFPIQNSHFFVVDVYVTCLITAVTYAGIVFLEKPSNKNAAFMGIFFALAIATKFTAVVFAPVIGAIFLLTFLGKDWKDGIKRILIFFIFLFGIFFLAMPYAIIDFIAYKKDLTEQLKMNSNPYIFPYTLQYVGTLPYWYYIKNIFFFGLGPFISILSVIGITNIFKHVKIKRHLPIIFYCICATFYFAIIGKSAVKFMRYMLPLYPFFTVMAGYGLYSLVANKKHRIIGWTLGGIFGIGALVWTGTFLNIYSVTHTRIAATEWILKHVPAGSTVAYEHWDDLVPLYGSQNFQMIELPLYNLPDNSQKWEMINQRLDSSDYIVIASNRLYVPLQRLDDCNKYESCYPLTSTYYKRLFSGKEGFKEIAQFSVTPNIKIGPWTLKIDDQWADESFTVYDHPKIMVFKKT